MADYDPLILLKGDLRRWIDRHAGEDRAELVWSLQDAERMVDILQWAFDRIVDLGGTVVDQRAEIRRLQQVDRER